MKPPTILLIDDSETDRATYRRFLSPFEQNGHQFVEFDLAESALTWCQTHTADVILLNYRLPDLDGLEVLSALQDQMGQTEFPLILLTAYSDITLAVEAVKRGAQDYLDKSKCTAAELQMRVQTALAQFQLKQTVLWQQKRQRLVATTALRIRQSLTLTDILQTAVEEVRSLLSTDRVVIYQVHPDWHGEVVSESVGEGWNSMLGAVIHDPCIEHGWNQPYQHRHVTDHGNISAEKIADCYGPRMQQFQVQANLVVPILQDDQLWGLFMVHQCSGPRQWQETEIELLQDLAVQLSIALQQAELHTQLQDEIRQRQQSEIRFQKMFEQSPEGKIRLTPDGWAIAANQAWVDIWEAPKATLTGYNILDDPAVALDSNLAGMKRAFAGETVAFPIFFYDPSRFGRVGRSHWLDTLMYPITDSTGQVLEVVMVSRDVTDRITAQQKQQRLIRLIENSPSFVGIANLDGQVTYVNPAGQALVGLEADQVTQTIIWDYQKPEENERFQTQIIPTVLATGQWEGEFEMRHFGGGELIPVWCNIFTLTDLQTGQPESIAAVVQDLRERKQSEQSLRENEEKLRLFIHHAPVGMAMFDRDMRYLTASQQWVMNYHLNASIESLSGRSHYEIFPDLPERWRQVHQRCLAGAVENGDDDLFVRTDGRQQWMTWKVRPWYTSAGEIGGIIIFALDVTQRKQVELALRKSEERWQLALVGNNDGIWDWEPQTNRVFLSPRWKEMLGFEEHEISNNLSEWSSRVHPDDLGWVTQALQDHFNHKTPFYSTEHRMLCKDGRYKWILDRGKALWDEQGNVVRMVGSHTDMTERRTLEESLRTSEERYRRLAETVEDVFWLEDAVTGKALYISPAYEKIWGRSPASLYENSLTWMDAIHPDDRSRVDQALQQLPTQKRYDTEYRILCPDSSIRWIHDRGFTIMDTDGNTVQFAGIAQDITDRKRNESELEKFKFLVEYSSDMVVLLSEDTQFQYANQAFCNAVGYGCEELYSMQACGIYVDGSPDLFQELWQIAQQGQLTCEIQHRTKSESIFDAEVSITYFTFAGQDYLGCFARDISDRKRAEKALQTSESRLRLAQTASKSGVWDWNITANTLFWSPEYYQLYELDSSQSPSFEAWLQYIHPDDRDRVTKETERALKDTSTYLRVEFRVISTGQPKWFAGIGQVFCNEADEPVRMLGITIDITEQKQTELTLQVLNAELEQRVLERTNELSQSNEKLEEELSARIKTQQALEESELKFRAIVDQGFEFIVLIQKDGTIVEANQPVIDMANQMSLNIIGHTFWTMPCWADQQAQLEAAFQQALNAETSRLEIKFYNPDGTMVRCANGSPVIHDVSLKSVRNQDGQIMFVVSQGRDISEQKQKEFALKESNRRWRSLLENVQLLVVGLDQTGNVEYVNPFFLELTQFTASDMVGQNWFETFTPKAQQPFLQMAFQEILEQNLHSHYQNPILTKVGEERMIAWSNTVLRNREGQAIGTISIGEDITDRYRLERMKSEFLSIVSHELRTPLTSISGALELLATGLLPLTSERANRSIQIAATEADRLTRLVNDILDLERLESGKLQLQIQPYNLAELMQRAVDFMQLAADQNQISLITLPLSLIVQFDSDRMLQVLTNLLSNAIKFSAPHSSVWLTATVHSDTVQPHVCLTVSDQGRGIPVEKLEMIFDRFQQVDASDSRQKGGTGLGLAICRNIVQQHGGKIWAESNLGQGSQFHLILPLIQTPA